jgi:prepilin-type N-terminal cleavage/methylation domain-containing protein
MKSSSNAFRRAAGFSLIEILIVMVLGGIVMAIGLPNLFHYIEHQKVLVITQQTAMVLRLARLESIKTANNAVVKVDTADRAVTGFMDLNQNLAQDANEPTLWRLNLPQGITASVNGFTTPPTPGVAVFRSNGSVGVAGDFRFKNGRGDQLEANVPGLNSGRVKILKLQGTLWKAQGEDGLSWKWEK